jgi:Fe-S cluster biogenesis protein NfuA
MAVAGAVQVFKRATSLGGVESLIEPRRRMEGPSSPVPADLLRLSIGLEALDDLVADLEAALGTVKTVSSAGTPVVSAEHAPTPTPRSDFAAAVASVVDRSVAPTVVARGGAVRVVGASDGVVTLEASGSPGAVLPILERIESLLRAAVPAVSEVRVVWPNGERAADTEPDEGIHRIRRVLDDKVNPAIAAHPPRPLQRRGRGSGITLSH